MGVQTYYGYHRSSPVQRLVSRRTKMLMEDTKTETGLKSFVATGSFSNHRNSQQQMVVWKLHTKLPSLFGVPFLAVPIQTKVSPYLSDPAPGSVTNPVLDPAPDLVPHPIPVKRTRTRIFKSRLISSRT